MNATSKTHSLKQKNYIAIKFTYIILYSKQKFNIFKKNIKIQQNHPTSTNIYRQTLPHKK